MKSKTIGYLLLVIGGVLGVHRLYAGRPGAWMAPTILGAAILFLLSGLNFPAGIFMLAMNILWAWDVVTMWKWDEFKGSEK